MTQGVPSTLAPGGPGAQLIAGLAWFLIPVAVVVVVIVVGLVMSGALRRSGTLAEHAPADTLGGTQWIKVGGILLPTIVLAVTFLLGERTLGRLPSGRAHAAATTTEPTIEVTGRQWWWQVRYRSADLTQEFATANEIHIPVGRPVLIELRSTDVIHSLWVPQLQPKEDLIPGRRNALVLQADKPGEYVAECAEYCGDEHARMAFRVVAESPERYEAWLAQRRAIPAVPAEPEAARGREVFLSNACAFCHAIRGTPAQGVVAPDLSDFATRPTIGAGTVPNTRPMLEGWIMNAPAMKPGTQMPAFPQLDASSLRALTAYLESLR